MSKVFHSAAVIAGFACAVFIGAFAFDVSSGIGVAFQLLPAAIVAAVTAVGIRKAFAGGVLCAIIAAVFAVFFHAFQNRLPFFVVLLPLLLAGVCFLLSAMQEKKGAGR